MHGTRPTRSSSDTHSQLHKDMRRRIESTIEQFAAQHGIVKEKAMLIARRGIDRLRNERLRSQQS
jgi:hypothetical protein